MERLKGKKRETVKEKHLQGLPGKSGLFICVPTTGSQYI